MVTVFADLAGLEDDLAFLNSLKVQAEAELAEELRAAEERVAELRAARQKPPESRQTKDERQVDIPLPSRRLPSMEKLPGMR